MMNVKDFFIDSVLRTFIWVNNVSFYWYGIFTVFVAVMIYLVKSKKIPNVHYCTYTHINLSSMLIYGVIGTIYKLLVNRELITLNSMFLPILSLVTLVVVVVNTTRFVLNNNTKK